MTYPFLIRGPTRGSRKRIVHVEATRYRFALSKVLALYPVKFVSTKHARNMVLIEAKVAAQKESKAQKGKTVFVYSDKTGEVDISLSEARGKGETNLTSYINGKEVKIVETNQTNESMKDAKKATPAKKADKVADKKPTAPKVEGIGKATTLVFTKAQWAKVDALVAKGETIREMARIAMIEKYKL